MKKKGKEVKRAIENASLMYMQFTLAQIFAMYAYYFIDECQSLGEIPDRIRNYIDYESYGRDLDLEGRFVITNHGVFECPY